MKCMDFSVLMFSTSSTTFNLKINSFSSSSYSQKLHLLKKLNHFAFRHHIMDHKLNPKLRKMAHTTTYLSSFLKERIKEKQEKNN